MRAALNGCADTRNAWISSAALVRRPSCAMADTRHATRPAACGAAMLVPPLISPPVAHGGTVENATPGVTMSGLASSPPRALNHPSTSRAGGTPGLGAWAKTPGYVAPTDRAQSAEPGKPLVASPGPGLA